MEIIIGSRVRGGPKFSNLCFNLEHVINFTDPIYTQGRCPIDNANVPSDFGSLFELYNLHSIGILIINSMRTFSSVVRSRRYPMLLHSTKIAVI